MTVPWPPESTKVSPPWLLGSKFEDDPIETIGYGLKNLFFETSLDVPPNPYISPLSHVGGYMHHGHVSSPPSPPPPTEHQKLIQHVMNKDVWNARTSAVVSRMFPLSLCTKEVLASENALTSALDVWTQKARAELAVCWSLGRMVVSVREDWALLPSLNEGPALGAPGEPVERATLRATLRLLAPRAGSSSMLAQPRLRWRCVADSVALPASLQP